MNQKELNQLQDIKMCESGMMSLEELAKRLKVSRAGLGHRIIALRRKEYNEENHE